MTDLITDKALEYLDELAAEDAPFYLSVHYTAPHSPWGPEHHPKKWLDYYQDCKFESIPDIPDHPDMTTGPVYGTPNREINLRGYFAAISAMDENIGRILQRLDEKGLTDNTPVDFCRGQRHEHGTARDLGQGQRHASDEYVRHLREGAVPHGVSAADSSGLRLRRQGERL